MIQINTLYTLFFVTESAGVAVAADSTPSATLYRNGSASGVTVTVAATATVGLYKATFTTDAGWAKTDVLHLVASATIDSTSGYVGVVWDSTGDVDAVMRGNDAAPLDSSATQSAAAAALAAYDPPTKAELDSAQSSIESTCATATGFAVAGDAMALTPTERSALAGVIDVALINQGDGADLIGALADAIAADWVAGDASPLAIVAALKADSEWSDLTAIQAAIDGLNDFDPANDTVARVTLVDTVTTNTDYTAPDNTAIAAIEAVAEKLDTALEDDGASGWQYTTLSLENGPSGSGGGDATLAKQNEILSAVGNVGNAGWDETELSQIRHRLGIDGTKEAPSESSPQLTVTVASTSVISVEAPNADDAGRFTITQRDDYENDNDIAPIGPIRISTTQGLLRESNPPTLRFGATQLLGRRYGSVHIVGDAYAEAVAGEPNQYDLYIEIGRDELDKVPGDYGWDIEAVYNDNDVSTLVRGTMTLKQSMGDHEDRVA